MAIVDSKQIPLSQGKFAIVDAEDFDFLNQWKWCAAKSGRTFYAIRSLYAPNGKETVRMHKLIADPNPDQVVDHKNGDGLDNRRTNLRNCSRGENSRNQILRITNTSGYKGVSWEKRGNRSPRWVAFIRHDGRRQRIGRFKEKIEAAKAYNMAALEYYGEFASLNTI